MSNVLSERFVGRRLANRESKDQPNAIINCDSKGDDAIVVEWRTMSICFVVQTTAFTSA